MEAAEGPCGPPVVALRIDGKQGFCTFKTSLAPDGIMFALVRFQIFFQFRFTAR